MCCSGRCVVRSTLPICTRGESARAPAEPAQQDEHRGRESVAHGASPWNWIGQSCPASVRGGRSRNCIRTPHPRYCPPPRTPSCTVPPRSRSHVHTFTSSHARLAAIPKGCALARPRQETFVFFQHPGLNVTSPSVTEIEPPLRALRITVVNPFLSHNWKLLSVLSVTPW